MAPTAESYIRLASGDVIGRIAVKGPAGEPRDRDQAIELAQGMPWWRARGSIAGRDAKYWVIVAPKPRNTKGVALASGLAPLRRAG
jgi:hypothetical protein